MAADDDDEAEYEEDDLGPESSREAMLAHLDSILQVPPQFQSVAGQFDDAEDDGELEEADGPEDGGR